MTITRLGWGSGELMSVSPAYFGMIIKYYNIPKMTLEQTYIRTQVSTSTF